MKKTYLALVAAVLGLTACVTYQPPGENLWLFVR